MRDLRGEKHQASQVGLRFSGARQLGERDLDRYREAPDLGTYQGQQPPRARKDTQAL